jgi:hypothetical protein
MQKASRGRSTDVFVGWNVVVTKFVTSVAENCQSWSAKLLRPAFRHQVGRAVAWVNASKLKT